MNEILRGAEEEEEEEERMPMAKNYDGADRARGEK